MSRSLMLAEKAPRSYGILDLPVSWTFRQRLTNRVENTGRDTNSFPIMIKAFYLGYAPAGTTASVSVLLKDDVGMINGCITVPMTITTADTDASIIAAVPSAVASYCSTNFGISIDDAEWLVQSNSAPITVPTDSALALSVQTGTGAVGTQVSTTQDVYVMVSTSISTSATIGGASTGDLVLEVAPTNSATASDWVEKGRNGNSQTISLAVALQSIQVIKGQMTALVPKGYYVKVRSITGSGTPVYAVTTARKVLL